MTRFVSFAFPVLLLILAVFGFVVDWLGLEPRAGSVMRFSSGVQAVPSVVVLGSWIMEACGLVALFLLAQGRCGNRWLDGLVAGWLAWVFRGPIFVVTIVIAARQPQDPWWRLAFAWWILYSVCGLVLAALASPAAEPSTEHGIAEDEPFEEPADEESSVQEEDDPTDAHPTLAFLEAEAREEAEEKDEAGDAREPEAER